MTDTPDETAPDPALDAIRGKLVRFFIINAVFLVAALMLVVGAIVYKSIQKPKDEVARPAVPGDAAHPLAATLMIPAGARLIGATAGTDRIALDLELSGGAREIRIFDAVDGAQVGRYAVEPE